MQPKNKIPGRVAKKCLNKIFGFPLPCRKSWKDMSQAFPNERLPDKHSCKTFIRQYVWKHCNEQVAHQYMNPFKDKNGNNVKNLLVENRINVFPIK